MKIKQILATSQQNKLSQLDIELLLTLVLKKDRIFVLANPETELSINQAKKFNALLKKRLNHFPFAYLSGYQSFYGLDFVVGPHTLIPRPETELMVDYVLVNYQNQDISLIDVGTGSGCIICSLAKNLRGKNLYFGLDISNLALKVAKANAKLNQVKQINFAVSDLLSVPLNNTQSLPLFSQNNKSKPLIITANLPYLSPKQIAQAPSIKYEPRRALDGGFDGLKYYKQLLPQVLELLNLGFKNISLLLEIDPGQNQILSTLIHKTFSHNLKSLKTKNDLAGLNRLIVIELNN